MKTAGFYEGSYKGRTFTIEHRADELDGKMMWFAIVHPCEASRLHSYLEPTWAKRVALARVQETIDDEG